MDIRIHGLTKVYRGRVEALRGIDLAIGPGLFGLLGPNGAGKTTLIRVLAGIVRPTRGSLTIDGMDGTTARGRAAVKRRLGYLPQELGLYPDLSAREFLDYIALLKGLDDRTARQQRVATLLEMVGLTAVAGRRLKTFSGGMKRRVGIAQALLNDPQLVIVDEPTAGLDPEERIHFRNLLADLGQERSVVLSTHIVDDVAQTCRELAVLNSGTLLFHGTVTELLRQAQGHVWRVTLRGSRPPGGLTVVSTIPVEDGVEYRVVGAALPDGSAWQDQAGLQVLPVVPRLEDAYVWLMREGTSTMPAERDLAPLQARSC
jgi:ABC-type multidrug transport system ATPase subunit